MAAATPGHICAVDVGTGSARAGIFDAGGRLLGRAEHPIAAHVPAPGRAEHDSEDIWTAAAAAVRGAVGDAGVRPEAIRGIGFDATCSLVIRGPREERVAASPGQPDRWDTIAWHDHRAAAEARLCDATGHPALDHLGGAMSPEMQIPKLMWLKRHAPDSWAKAGRISDLADHLTRRACGTDARSRNTLVCKWACVPEAGGQWDDFLARIGLEDLRDRAGLPAADGGAPRGVPVGAPIGRLGARAAAELGLSPGCVVGAGLIDAFAGALAAIGGAGAPRPGPLALITGTSTCIMAFTPDGPRIPGVWGPYPDATLPGLWMSEGGQSATGALLNRVIEMHGFGPADAAAHGRVSDRIEALVAQEGPDFAGDVHVLPDFHGNRTPFADSAARGVISGLSLDSSFDGLCRIYWRTAVALALGVRRIVEHMGAHGCPADALHLAGGHRRSPVLTRLYAAATGLPVRIARDDDAMLRGTAMAAAAASDPGLTLDAACRAMRAPMSDVAPDPALRDRLEADYRAFLLMGDHRRQLLAAVAGAAPNPAPNPAPKPAG